MPGDVALAVRAGPRSSTPWAAPHEAQAAYGEPAGHRPEQQRGAAVRRRAWRRARESTPRRCRCSAGWPTSCRTTSRARGPGVRAREDGRARGATELYASIVEAMPTASIARSRLAEVAGPRGSAGEGRGALPRGHDPAADGARLPPRARERRWNERGSRQEAAVAYREYARLAPNNPDAERLAARVEAAREARHRVLGLARAPLPGSCRSGARLCRVDRRRPSAAEPHAEAARRRHGNAEGDARAKSRRPSASSRTTTSRRGARSPAPSRICPATEGRGPPTSAAR